MLTQGSTNCKNCVLISGLIEKIDCQIAKMSNNLYMNISYMLDRPVEAVKISALLHYKRILKYKACNSEWVVLFDLPSIASRVNFLTANCDCCNKQNSVFYINEDQVPTTITTTTIVSP